MKELHCPLSKEDIASLQVGDTVFLTGTIFTARDAAHKKMMELITAGMTLPFDPKGAVIYYVGPTPPPEGRVIGSAGPTTSYRMDAYTPALLELGLGGMVGKGRRGSEVVASMVKNQSVYFGAIGGAGALIAECIKEAKIIAWEELGTEALRQLEVERMPVTVVIDSQGQSLYVNGPRDYLTHKENQNE